MVATVQCTSVFDIRLERCTQTLCRLIGLFAQRDEALSVLTLTDIADVQILTIATDALAPDDARIVAARMRQFIAVYSVMLRSDYSDASQWAGAVGNTRHPLPLPCIDGCTAREVGDGQHAAGAHHR